MEKICPNCQQKQIWPICAIVCSVLLLIGCATLTSEVRSCRQEIARLADTAPREAQVLPALTSPEVARLSDALEQKTRALENEKKARERERVSHQQALKVKEAEIQALARKKNAPPPAPSASGDPYRF